MVWSSVSHDKLVSVQLMTTNNYKIVQKLYTIVYLLEVRSALPNTSVHPPKRSAHCPKIVAPLQNRSAPVNDLAPGDSDKKLISSLHKYIFKHDMYCSRSLWQPRQRQRGLLLIAWVGHCLCGLAGRPNCLRNHEAVTHYKRPHDMKNGSEWKRHR